MSNGPLLGTLVARALDRREAARPERSRGRQLVERFARRVERRIARPAQHAGRPPARDRDAAIEG